MNTIVRLRLGMMAALLLVRCSAFAPEETSHEVEVFPVTGTRLIAVVAEPPEVFPGETSQLRAVFALPVDDPEGDSPAPVVERWSYCTKPRVPGSTGTAPASCLAKEFTLFASNTSGVAAVLPTDGCRNFGPEPPENDFRPQDPDETGGYFQPLRLDASNALWFHFQRLRCRLGDASTAVAKSFSESYVPNRNPRPSKLEVSSAASQQSKEVSEQESIASLAWNSDEAQGPVLQLSLLWNENPREEYVRFAALTGALETTREEVWITWHHNSGALTASLLERLGSGYSAEATWAPDPASQGAAVWAVLHDSRGGTAVVHFGLEVGFEPSAPR